MIDLSFLNPFKKKKEPSSFPNKFALVRYSKHAKDLGIYDDENKIVEIYKNLNLVESIPFTKELVNSLEEVDEIPVAEESFEEEPFEFEEVASFGNTEFKR